MLLANCHNLITPSFLLSKTCNSNRISWRLLLSIAISNNVVIRVSADDDDVLRYVFFDWNKDVAISPWEAFQGPAPLLHMFSSVGGEFLTHDMIACDVVNPDHIDMMFESIGGLDSTKQELYELAILLLLRPELFANGRLLGPQKGVLLYGPPGTWKTMLAKAIAKESRVVFINVRVSNLMSKWFCDAQKLGKFIRVGDHS